MSDLDDAVKRLRRWNSGDHSEITDDAMLHANRSIVADAYLAEHPDDEDMPVTIGWCETFWEDSSWGSDEKRYLLCESLSIRFVACVGGWSKPMLVLGDWTTDATPTRGNVRRFCEAMLIPLET